MRETQLVEHIKALARQSHCNPSLKLGIGDDCAVFRPAANTELVFTTDFTIEDRHFTLDTHTAADIGHKALARSLSDLAAMGAKPEFCLVSLALRSEIDGAWVKRFYKGLTALAARYQLSLAGGDLAKSDKVTVDVMCCGTVPRGKALLRSGARPGHNIYISGELGASSLGLSKRIGSAWARHKRPEPRIDLGLRLVGLASAAMDLSDGLSLDLARLCKESSVGARLGSSLPIAKGASLDEALHGGEDYELLFTAAPRKMVPARIAGVTISRIGCITGEPDTITYDGAILNPLGFDHFNNAC
jgi:thiamine-monophosphate kinase